ncbi:MAG: RNA-binding S4 domain-containing protein [Lachnospiraceae bacterium]|nr:RNA-binding S4 domain-containing protein [Lachnospiraceae bacterium]
MKTVKVSGEYIQLNQFLKLESIAYTGGHAREIIENGDVKVNGEVTDVIRKKLRTGDVVEAGGESYLIETEE